MYIVEQTVVAWYQSCLPSTAATAAAEAVATAISFTYHAFFAAFRQLTHLFYSSVQSSDMMGRGIRVTHRSIPQCTQASCETLWVRAAAGRRVVTLVGLSLGGGLPKKIKKDSWPVKTHDAVTCSELCGRVSRVSSLRATIFVRALLSNGYRYKEGYSR